MIVTYRVLSALLSYPTEEICAAAPAMRAAIVGEGLLRGPALVGVDRLLAEFETRDLYDLQERHVLLFDRSSGKLLTAVLYDEEGKPATVLYRGNRRAQTRRWDQLPRRGKTCLHEVLAAWGPEDYGFGSGIDYRVWELRHRSAR